MEGILNISKKMAFWNFLPSQGVHLHDVHDLVRQFMGYGWIASSVSFHAKNPARLSLTLIHSNRLKRIFPIANFYEKKHFKKVKCAIFFLDEEEEGKDPDDPDEEKDPDDPDEEKDPLESEMSNDAKDDENEEEETEEDKIDHAEKEGEEDVDEDENDEEKAADDTDLERVCIIYSFGEKLLKTFPEMWSSIKRFFLHSFHKVIYHLDKTRLKKGFLI